MELHVVDINREYGHIALSGKLDVEGEGQIKDQFQEVTAKANRCAVVDMAGVTYLASLGIRLLFSCAKSLSVGGYKLVVLNPQPMVEETLMTSGTVNFIPIARSLEEALDLIRG